MYLNIMAKKKVSASKAPAKKPAARRGIRRRAKRQSSVLSTVANGHWMGQALGRLSDDAQSTLSPDEIGFLYVYAATGDKRESLKIAYGLDTDALAAWQIYKVAQPILIRADRCGDWREALRRHEMTLDELAHHIKRLLTCGNPMAEVNALKLALMTSHLIQPGDRGPVHSGPGAIFHFHMHQSPSPPSSSQKPLLLESSAFPIVADPLSHDE